MRTKIVFPGILFFTFILITCAPLPKTSPATGSAEIYGVVSDSSTGEPLAGAQVKLADSRGISTDYDGRYSVKNLAAGTYTVKVEASGYRLMIIKNVKLNPGVHLKLDAQLQESPLKSDPKISKKNQEYTTRQQGEKPPVENKPESRVPPEKYEPVRRDLQSSILKAAAHNDNEEYPFYLDYLQRYNDVDEVVHLAFRNRYTVYIQSGQGDPLFNMPFSILKKDGSIVWKSVTYTNGESVIFPEIMHRGEKPGRLFIRVEGENGGRSYPVNTAFERITTIRLSQSQPAAGLPLDLLFILDTTGSMGDEIQQLKDNLVAIYTRISNSFAGLPLRFGLVVYRDRGDDYVVNHFPFTENIAEFQRIIDQIETDGGGDKPEDLQSALKTALSEMQWNPQAVKLSFIMADAPPHTDYKQDFDYVKAALEAARRGIKIYTIGASGLDAAGEYVFRQLAALTYSEFIFLTYGESGESEGSGDPGKVSHHTGDNYESHNLDDLVVNIVRRELSYQIPGMPAELKPADPRNQEYFLQIRLDNLWAQMLKQIDEFSPDDTVAVLAPFRYSDSLLNQTADFLQQLSTISLLQHPRIKLVERERLQEILQEWGLTLSGIIESENYGELHRLLKSDFLFLGDLSFAGMERVVFMKAVRTNDGEVIAAARIRI
ncbi:MAG: carboxypeptidase regulatory-like domain-containing protein [Calditrichia bacterium]